MTPVTSFKLSKSSGLPWQSVVKILPNNAGGVGSIPDKGTKIPCCTVQPKLKI